MRYLGIAIACAFAWFTGPVQAAPLDAYGDLPTLSDVTISPNGTRISYAGENKGERFVVIQELTTGQLLAALKPGDRKVRGIQWADDDHVLITYSDTIDASHAWRRELYQTWVFDIVDKTQTNLMLHAGLYIAETPQVHVVGGRTIAYVEGFGAINPLSEGWRLTLYAVDVDTANATVVKMGTRDTDDFIVDANGGAVALSEYTNIPGHWNLKLHIGNDWKDVYGEDALLDAPAMLGISPDGTALQINSHKGGGTKMLAFSLADGRPVPSVLAGNGYLVFNRQTGRIAAERFVEHDVSYRFFDANEQEKWQKVLGHFPGEQVELASASDDRNRIIVHVTGRQHGDVFELVDVSSDTIALVGPVSRRISAADIARVTQFSYAAADGRQIDAYLTLPSGRQAEKLPLIVMPHGGPQARDEPGFDWWAQSLASLGYAVLQPEFRGSGQMGWDLLSAGFGEFGRKMQTDLSDGVRALSRTGIIDPKRVCIVGASYGGYAALAGATIDRGVYRCAVSVGGISDPAWSVDAPKKYEVTRYWMRYLGVTQRDDPVLETISPLKHAADADVPILLIYGNNDSVVPTEQSEKMAAALKGAGKTYKLIALEGEDHWLSRSKTRVEMLKSCTDFLLANNPP